MQNVSIAFTDDPKTGHAYSYFHTMYPNVDLNKVHYTHSFIDDLGYVNFNYTVDSKVGVELVKGFYAYD